MEKYRTLDELATALWSSAESDTTNPVAAYVLTYSGKPKGLMSKFRRCPKLKVESYSKSEPIWTGSVTIDGQLVPLSQIIDKMMSY